LIDVVFFMFLGFLCGATAYTGYSYFWRRRQGAEFRWVDLLALLVSLGVDFVFSPLLNVPGAVPAVLRGLGSGYVLLSSFGFALAVNFFVVKPLEYLDRVPQVAVGRGHTRFGGFVRRRMADLRELPNPVSKKFKRFWIVAVILASIVPLGFVYAALQYTVTISTEGTIISREFSFYTDAACTSKTERLNWGELEPGGQVTRTLYMKSTLKEPVVASLAVGNFNPAAGEAYLALTWNYSGVPVGSGQVVPVVFTLSVASTVTGITAFSFDISVTATG
jgi:hypothetical protein